MFLFSQFHYIEKLLKMFNCFDIMPVRTPYGSSISLKNNKGPSVLEAKYAKIIGSVIFLMNYTRHSLC